MSVTLVLTQIETQSQAASRNTHFNTTASTITLLFTVNHNTEMSTTQQQRSIDDAEIANEQPKKNNAAVNSNDISDDVVPTSVGEAQLLVSEFPPPPYYYRLAGTGIPSGGGGGGGVLRAPPIPTDAINRGTYRAAAIAARARETERQLRLAELRRGDDSQGNEDDKTDSILGGVIKDATIDEHAEGDVVAVFGEIVEDPLLVEPLDDCNDPMVVRDEVKRLHQIVLRTFVRMVQDLVHRPLENKYVFTTLLGVFPVSFHNINSLKYISVTLIILNRLTRDELSHNIFLMLQECNKFREHQSREILIAMLEEQLAERQKLVRTLREQNTKAKATLL